MVRHETLYEFCEYLDWPRSFIMPIIKKFTFDKIIPHFVIFLLLSFGLLIETILLHSQAFNEKPTWDYSYSQIPRFFKTVHLPLTNTPSSLCSTSIIGFFLHFENWTIEYLSVWFFRFFRGSASSSFDYSRDSWT